MCDNNTVMTYIKNFKFLNTENIKLKVEMPEMFYFTRKWLQGYKPILVFLIVHRHKLISINSEWKWAVENNRPVN
jgi:hypothetical protein